MVFDEPCYLPYSDKIPMKKIFLYVFLGTCLLGCDPGTSLITKVPSTLYLQPKSFPINLNKGYSNNIINGKNIDPIIQQGKDTLITGHSFPIKSQKLDLKPVILSLTNKQIQKQPLYANVKQVNEPVIHRVRGQKQTLAKRQEMVTNSKGEVIPTGIPLSFTGQKQLMKFTSLSKATLPHYRDNALYDVQVFGAQQGFNSSIVYDICKSKRGGKWLATYEGISYYDGTSFAHFTSEEGLPNGNVRAILEDSKGNVWFCPKDSGLCKYDGDTLTVFDEAGGLMSNAVFNLTEDTYGNIWWCTFQGVTKYDGKNITHYHLGHTNYTKIYADAEGFIWAASNQEIVKFDGENLVSFDLKKMIFGARVATIFGDKEGNMWFGLHRGGILKYDGEKFLQYSKDQGLPGKSVYSLLQDKAGNIWMGTNKGLVKYRQGKFDVYTINEGLAGNFIIKILEDEQQNLWLGTYRAGFMKYTPASFRHHYLQKANQDEMIRSFYEDAQGVLWAITRNSGLLKIENDTITTISLDNPYINNIAYALTKDKQNNVWIGVKGGVIKYTPKQCVFYPVISQDNYVTALSNDAQNNVWIGAEQGVIKYDGQHFVKYYLPLNSRIRDILVDKKGVIWLGTRLGLCSLKGERAVLYTEKEGLSDVVVTSLLEDSKGRIWVGTYNGGVMTFDGKTFTYYTVKEGLLSNYVKSMVEDRQGNIWLGTEKGLSLMHLQEATPSKANHHYKIINYGQESGLKALDFEPRCVVLDKHNTLWWGTGKAVVSLDLNSFKIQQKAPQVHLRQLDINGTFIDFRLLPDSLKSAITFRKISAFENYPSYPILDHRHKHIKLYFSVPNAEKPQKIKYSYRIKGWGKSWSQASEQPLAEYQNLPYGIHTFQVRAIGEAQIWSKTLEYTFEVRPPFWKSKGFILLYVIGGIAFIIIYIKWRLSRLVKKQFLLERKVAERTLNLNEAIQQLNKLNIDLHNSKTEVIELKEKEQKILTSQIRQRENELLLIIKTINERLCKATMIKDNLFSAIEKGCNESIASAAKDFSKFLESTSNIDILMERIEEKYPGMLMKIKLAYPDLSANDIKHCLYIKLNLTLKEIAQLHNVSVSAVKAARNRLKKKMNIPEDVSLKYFIGSEF